MKVLTADKVAMLAPYSDLIEALRHGFQAQVETPVRHHHSTSPATTLLLMPAWNSAFTGLKTVTVKTDNAALGLPTVQAAYLLIDNATGTPVAMMDGTELTRRRTAAASALASSYLSRGNASTLLVIGAGALATHFVRAHAAVRPLKHILIYNRTAEKAAHVVQELRADGFLAQATENLKAAMEQADIISGITSSTEALIKGAWLKPGTHIDLAGAFKPSMRETDGEAVGKARVFVDTYEGALAEAGDLIQAQAEGFFEFSKIEADLAELCRGQKWGRHTETEITLFKSCGTALEDLAAAEMVYLRS
jgi:ornithine cyclodeaminase/alanine dehydrogenase-like protein (mu-crystallin family)